jgi:predicted TIM-barrel fold metal-dependent hydrolase
MRIDIHTHLFFDAARQNRERFFPGEPAFELLYRPRKSPMAGVDDILAAMDEDGVDKSVVFGFPWTNPDLSARHNDYILEAAARHPDRLVPFACFDVEGPDPAEEARRRLDAGAAGLGELALYRSGVDDSALARLEPVMALARERNAPVLIHTNEPVGHVYPGKTPITPGQIWGLLERFPQNRLILAHWGGGVFFYHLMKRGAKERFNNVWLDTAASPFLYDSRIWDIACRTIGADKVLLGTDYPLLRAKRYFKELGETGLDPADIARITGGNAAALLSAR